MHINKAKHLLMQGKPAIGISVALGSPLSAETLSLVGFDFVLVDNQHGIWDGDTSLSAFRSICLGGATPMARVEHNSFFGIGSLLDRGALGIVVPMVDSVEDARAAVRAVRYPPQGRRSVGGAATAFLGSDYRSRANEEVFLAVQIESYMAVEQAEEILGVDGVDGCWIGPSDLALSMRVGLDTREGKKVHEAAILTVRDACHKTGKIPGIAGTPETAQHWLDHGFLFVTTGNDRSVLANGAASILEKLGRPV